MDKIGKLKRLVIVPGNGCFPIRDCNWYSWLAESVKEKHPTVEILLKDMPDPYRGRILSLKNFLTTKKPFEFAIDHYNTIV